MYIRIYFFQLIFIPLVFSSVNKKNLSLIFIKIGDNSLNFLLQTYNHY